MKRYFIYISIFLLIRSCNSRQRDDILNYSSSKRENGYHFRFDTSDGIHRDETATILNKGEDESILQVFGQYSYQLPNGQYHLVRYKADEQGFKPEIHFRYAKTNTESYKEVTGTDNKSYLKLPFEGNKVKFRKVMNVRRNALRQDYTHFQSSNDRSFLGTSTKGPVLRKRVLVKTNIGSQNKRRRTLMEVNIKSTTLQYARSTSSTTTARPSPSTTFSSTHQPIASEMHLKEGTTNKNDTGSLIESLLEDNKISLTLPPSSDVDNATIFPTLTPIPEGPTYENETLSLVPPPIVSGPPSLEIGASAIGSLAGGGLG